MGIPDKKSIKRTQTISCQGVGVTKMNVFFTDTFWDDYGLHMGLQDIKMSDLLLFMKCFSESWHCNLLSRRCQVTIFNFYFGVWRKAGLMWLDGWTIQSFLPLLPFHPILTLSGVLQVLDNCNQVSRGFQDASGMKVGSWNASGCTHTDQQNLFTFGTSPRKCSVSRLTGGCRCWGESWEERGE